RVYRRDEETCCDPHERRRPALAAAQAMQPATGGSTKFFAATRRRFAAVERAHLVRTRAHSRIRRGARSGSPSASALSSEWNAAEIGSDSSRRRSSQRVAPFITSWVTSHESTVPAGPITAAGGDVAWP